MTTVGYPVTAGEVLAASAGLHSMVTSPGQVGVTLLNEILFTVIIWLQVLL
jgi:hypothetical protein